MRIAASAIWMSILVASLVVPGARADEKNASPKVPEAATVSGKYSGLLKILSVPADEATFGRFCDYGYDSSPEWGGQANLPPGFWVYVAPNWYLWKNSKAKEGLARTAVPGDEFSAFVGHHISIEMEGHSAIIEGTLLATGAHFLTMQMEPRAKKLLVNKAKIIYVEVDEATRPK